MDGVGKSTVCKILSERTGFKNIDKPLRFLFNDEGDYAEYIRIRDKVNAHSDRVFTAWFYGLSATYLYAEHENEVEGEDCPVESAETVLVGDLYLCGGGGAYAGFCFAAGVYQGSIGGVGYGGAGACQKCVAWE